jgi:DNA-binding NarL/FixJ family response regulator
MLAVAIVDDHPVKRAGLEKFVSGHAELSMAVSARCAEDLLAGAAPFDVAILGVPPRAAGPVLSAIELVADRCPVVVSSSWERPLTLGAVLRAGARGYVAGHCDEQIIVSALVTVGQGGFYVCPELADRFQSELVGNLGGDPAGLAPREVETLRWIARGFTHGHRTGAHVGRRSPAPRSVIAAPSCPSAGYPSVEPSAVRNARSA